MESYNPLNEKFLRMFDNRRIPPIPGLGSEKYYTVVISFDHGSADPTVPRLAVSAPIPSAEAIVWKIASWLSYIFSYQVSTRESVAQFWAGEFIAPAAQIKEVVPVNPDVLPTNIDYTMRMIYDYTLSSVGDRTVIKPSVRLEMYQPVHGSIPERGIENVAFFPRTAEERDAHLWGTMVLSVEAGILHIEQATGWLGTQSVIDFLRTYCEAALAL